MLGEERADVLKVAGVLQIAFVDLVPTMYGNAVYLVWIDGQ